MIKILCLLCAVFFNTASICGAAQFEFVGTGVDLASHADVTFPTPASIRSRSIDGSSLTFGGSSRTQPYEILVRFDMGAFTASDGSLRIQLEADVTRRSGDFDPFFVLWNGSDTIGGGLFDNSGGGIQSWSSSSDGIHASDPTANLHAFGAIGGIGSREVFVMDLLLDPGRTLIHVEGAGASLNAEHSDFDYSGDLSLLIHLQEDWEQISLNSLSIVVVPEPNTAILLGLGLTALAVRRGE